MHKSRLLPVSAEPVGLDGQTRDGDARSLAHWLARNPPGWISRHAAECADPIQLASEIQLLSAAFVAWMHLPHADRWDDFALQSLSAALFNRYRTRDKAGVKKDLDLFDLAWPEGTDDIRSWLVQMRKLLEGPFAVFKAVRSAVARDSFPSSDDLCLAEVTLVSGRTALEEASRQLHEFLERFHNKGIADAMSCANTRDDS